MKQILAHVKRKKNSGVIELARRLGILAGGIMIGVMINHIAEDYNWRNKLETLTSQKQAEISQLQKECAKNLIKTSSPSFFEDKCIGIEIFMLAAPKYLHYADSPFGKLVCDLNVNPVTYERGGGFIVCPEYNTQIKSIWDENFDGKAYAVVLRNDRSKLIYRNKNNEQVFKEADAILDCLCSKHEYHMMKR